MGIRVLIWLLAVCMISGCASLHKRKAQVRKKRQTLADVYAASVGQSRHDMRAFIEGKLVEQQTFGYVKPYVPVVEAPVVRKVWIPDQKSTSDPDVLVAGHWTYVMVQGPRWFIDAERTADQPQEILVPAQPASEPQSVVKGKKSKRRY